MDPCDRLDYWDKFTPSNRFETVKDLINQYAEEHGMDPVNVKNEAYPDDPDTEVDESKYSGAYDPDSRTVYLNPDLFNSDNPGDAFDTAGHEMVHAEAHDTFPGDPYWDTDEGHAMQESVADEYGSSVAKDLQAPCNRPPPSQSPAEDDDLGDFNLDP